MSNDHAELRGALQFPTPLATVASRLRPTAGWRGPVGRPSGMWMTVMYADAPGGVLLWSARLVVGTAMSASIVQGVVAIRRGNVAAHRAWMIRAYALAVGAGTQVFTQGVGEGLFGRSDLSTALSVSAGWVINITVAEVVIRRPSTRRAYGARNQSVLVGSR